MTEDEANQALGLIIKHEESDIVKSTASKLRHITSSIIYDDEEDLSVLCFEALHKAALIAEKHA